MRNLQHKGFGASTVGRIGYRPLLLCLSLACDRTPPGVERPRAPGSEPAAENSAPNPVPSSVSKAAPSAPGVGEAAVPFDFPQVATAAKAGDYVLAPPRAWIDAGLERGGDKQTFIYYGAWMRRPGQAASQIETLTKQTSVIPNALIIPIKSGQRVVPGDVVLTTWASGTGMQRAMVVEGGHEARPRVRYLDMSLDHPTGWGEREDNLPEKTFIKLDQPGEVGSSAACLEGTHRMRYIITARSGDKLLGYGFAGRIAAFKEADCQFLSLRPKLKENDVVSVPVIGRYTKAKVLRVDHRIGRVWGRHKAGQEDQVTAFAVLDATRTLE